MEGAHRELRAGLADRLRGHDADGLAHVDLMPAAEIAAVTLDAHALARLAGQHRADLDPFDARPPRCFCDHVLVDHLVGADQDLVGERIEDVLSATRPSTRSPRPSITSPPSTSGVISIPSSVPQSLLGDDRILRHVHQTAGEVAGIRRLERGIRQTLARAVGRDEVLQHRQPLAEIRGDRRLDDLARRLGHQAAHAGELPDLLLANRGRRNPP